MGYGAPVQGKYKVLSTAQCGEAWPTALLCIKASGIKAHIEKGPNLMSVLAQLVCRFMLCFAHVLYLSEHLIRVTVRMGRRGFGLT